MKSFFLIPVLFFLLSTAGVQICESKDAELFRVGLSSNAMGTINPNDYTASFKSWANTVGKERGLQITADAQVVDVDDHLRDVLLKGSLDAILITVQDLMFLKLQPEDVFVTTREKDFSVTYAIIVHRDSNITGLDRIIGSKISTYNGNQMTLARSWLEVLTAKHTRGQFNPLTGGLIVMKNPSKCILQVFFRQTQAALVTESTFELACELNPQLRKDLKVLAVSQPFISNFFIFLPSYQGPSRKKLETAIVNLHATPGGRQILSIFQSSRMEKKPVSVLEPTRQFLTEYQRLVNEGATP